MNRKNILILVLVFVVAAGAGFSLTRVNKQQQAPSKTINSFEQCVQAGYIVSETYPQICTIPGGKSFGKRITSKPLQPISRLAALNLIQMCKATGTYSLHSGELGLTMKSGEFQPVSGTTEDDLRQNQNPNCPFTSATME